MRQPRRGYWTLSAYILSSNAMHYWVGQIPRSQIGGHASYFVSPNSFPTVKALECLLCFRMCASAHCIHCIFMFKPTRNPTSDTVRFPNHNNSRRAQLDSQIGPSTNIPFESLCKGARLQMKRRWNPAAFRTFPLRYHVPFFCGSCLYEEAVRKAIVSPHTLKCRINEKPKLGKSSDTVVLHRHSPELLKFEDRNANAAESLNEAPGFVIAEGNNDAATGQMVPEMNAQTVRTAYTFVTTFGVRLW